MAATPHCLSVAFLLAIPTVACAQQWTLVSLAPPQPTVALANGGAGGHEGGVLFTSNGTHAVIWSHSAASMVDLHPNVQGMNVSQVLGCSPSAQVGYTYNGIRHAALWSGTAQSWVDIHPPALGETVAYGVFGGLQVGADLTTGFWHALVFNSNISYADINPIGADASAAFAIDGTSIVGSLQVATFPNAIEHAILWQALGATWTDLNPPGSLNSTANGVSGTEQVGYAAVNGHAHACLWHNTAASWVDLHPQGLPQSIGVACANGMQVGWVEGETGGRRASFWNGTAESWFDLNSVDNTYYNTQATGIWQDNGVTYVSGFGSYGFSGRQEPLLWMRQNPPSCPADVGSAGGVSASDGHLDNNDFIAFISLFFDHDPRADVGKAGGFPGSDGAFDNNDFIAFISDFFAGC